MSAWKIAVRELYERGGSGTLAQLSASVTHQAMKEAIRRGMVKGPGKGTHGRVPYLLTALGAALAEGRLQMVVSVSSQGLWHRRHGSELVPRPTWLASLPTGIRLEQPCNAL